MRISRAQITPYDRYGEPIVEKGFSVFFYPGLYLPRPSFFPREYYETPIGFRKLRYELSPINNYVFGLAEGLQLDLYLDESSEVFKLRDFLNEPKERRICRFNWQGQIFTGILERIGSSTIPLNDEKQRITAAFSIEFQRFNSYNNQRQSLKREMSQTIRAGDTLYRLATEYYGDPYLWRIIAHKNELMGSKPGEELKAGKMILIPPSKGGGDTQYIRKIDGSSFEEDSNMFVANGWKLLEEQEETEHWISGDGIREAISVILLTPRGSRQLRPDFGSDLSSFVFFRWSELTKKELERILRQDIEIWEPRVELISVTADTSDEETLHVTIEYRVKATKDQHSLIMDI